MWAKPAAELRVSEAPGALQTEGGDLIVVCGESTTLRVESVQGLKAANESLRENPRMVRDSRRKQFQF